MLPSILLQMLKKLGNIEISGNVGIKWFNFEQYLNTYFKLKNFFAIETYFQ